MMICVFLAIRALFTVGKPRASSKELVWSDCVPPNTAAMASITVRITLLYGSCITIKMTKRKLHWVYVKIWNFFFLLMYDLMYLLCQRPARCLAVCAQEKGLCIFGLEVFLDERGPKPPGCPQLCNFHVEIHPDSPEERKPE